MCEPVTLATAALVTTGVATATSSVAAYQGQRAANASARYQAKVAEQNAVAAEKSAEQAAYRGLLDLSAHYQKVGALIGAQRAAFAGAGVRVDMGTPAQVVEETALAGEQDAMMLRYNTALESWAKRHQAWDWKAKSKLLRASASSPFLAAAGPFLSGAAQFGGLYAGFAKEGLLSRAPGSGMPDARMGASR